MERPHRGGDLPRGVRRRQRLALFQQLCQPLDEQLVGLRLALVRPVERQAPNRVPPRQRLNRLRRRATRTRQPPRDSTAGQPAGLPAASPRRPPAPPGRPTSGCPWPRCRPRHRPTGAPSWDRIMRRYAAVGLVPPGSRQLDRSPAGLLRSRRPPLSELRTHRCAHRRSSSLPTVVAGSYARNPTGGLAPPRSQVAWRAWSHCPRRRARSGGRRPRRAGCRRAPRRRRRLRERRRSHRPTGRDRCPLIERALIPLCEELGAAIVDGGTDAGLMRLVGRARTATHAQFPLIGARRRERSRPAIRRSRTPRA